MNMAYNYLPLKEPVLCYIPLYRARIYADIVKEGALNEFQILLLECIQDGLSDEEIVHIVNLTSHVIMTEKEYLLQLGILEPDGDACRLSETASAILDTWEVVRLINRTDLTVFVDTLTGKLENSSDTSIYKSSLPLTAQKAAPLIQKNIFYNTLNPSNVKEFLAENSDKLYGKFISSRIIDGINLKVQLEDSTTAITYKKSWIRCLPEMLRKQSLSPSEDNSVIGRVGFMLIQYSLEYCDEELEKYAIICGRLEEINAIDSSLLSARALNLLKRFNAKEHFSKGLICIYGNPYTGELIDFIPDEKSTNTCIDLDVDNSNWGNQELLSTTEQKAWDCLWSKAESVYSEFGPYIRIKKNLMHCVVKCDIARILEESLCQEDQL